MRIRIATDRLTDRQWSNVSRGYSSVKVARWGAAVSSLHGWLTTYVLWVITNSAQF